MECGFFGQERMKNKNNQLLNRILVEQLNSFGQNGEWRQKNRLCLLPDVQLFLSHVQIRKPYLYS
jgi:hypothetical protein